MSLGPVEYAAWVGGSTLAQSQIDERFVVMHLDRQLRRFARIRPSDHPSTGGWTRASGFREQTTDPLPGIRVTEHEEVVPVCLMRAAARGILAPGPDMLDNLCATVMLASGCVVSMHRVDFETDVPHRSRPVLVPDPWSRPPASNRGGVVRGDDRQPTDVGRLAVCVSGVRGCDFTLARTLLDALFSVSSSEGRSGLCWSQKLTISSPVSSLTWKEAAIFPVCGSVKSSILA